MFRLHVSRRRGSILISALVLASTGLIGCSGPAAETDASIAMFRGTPEHSGVYESAGFEAIGGVLWTFATGGAIRSSPAVAGQHVYFGSADGNLYALDRTTGEPRWRFDAGSSIVSSPAVGHGLVFFQDRAGVIRAVDRLTGQERWSVTTGSEMPFPWGNEGWDYFVSSPVLEGDLLLIGAGDGNLYALDATTGEQRWWHATEGRIRSSPAIADSVVFVGSADGSVHAVSLATGERVWRYDTEGRSLVSAEFGFDRRTIQSSPTVAGDLVLVGSRDGRVYALDRRTGERRWTASHGTSWVVSSPAIAGDAVIAGSSDGFFVHAVDLSTGEERWRTRTGSNVFGSAAIVGPTAWVGDFTGAVLGFDIATGEVRSRAMTGGAVMSSPVVVDDVMYVGSDDGNLYALQGVTNTAAPRRAVFWDSALAGFSGFRDRGRLKDVMVAAGYELLDERGVASFMEETLASGRPGTVVFALDYIPPTIAAEPSDTVLFRRFLEGPGRVVWVGYPPMSIVWDRAAGRPTALDMNRTTLLTGVAHDRVALDSYNATSEPAGRAVGLPEWWIDGGGVPADQVTTVFARDENGLAVAWEKRYAGPPGSGLIRLWAAGQPLPDPSMVLRLAERAWR